jgi:trimeric autotransporter adhesin
MKTKNVITLRLRNPIDAECFRGFLLIALVCFGLVPAPKAFGVSPAPDGGYAGGNTAEGTNALFSLTTGVWNTALGYQALFHDTTGNQNTATGYQALFSVTTGRNSVANGAQALYNNTVGSLNTATGFRTLFANTTGSANTGNGFGALNFNTTGGDNTADGSQALYANTTGSGNTAVGFTALFSNATALNNTAIGAGALFSNTSGESNTATGKGALSNDGTGSGNTANGANALSGGRNGNVTADWSNNTAVGANALIGGPIAVLNNNTAVGAGTLPLGLDGGQNNIAIGYQAGMNLQLGDNNIDIGNPGVAGDANAVRIGTQGTQMETFIAGISGTAVSGVAVVVSAGGQLGVASSSQRFKADIKPMDKASEAILALKPVTFRYKHELDPAGIPQFGLVAEQVEKVNPDLVARDAEGKIFTVRYEAVNAMLLNEFLKEHRRVEQQNQKIQEQEATMAQLKSTVAKQEATIAEQQEGFESKIAHQQEQIEALTAGLQSVSAQVEMSHPAPQMVFNNQ